MPTIHGLELTHGDDLGLDATPDCCDTEMNSKGTLTGYRHFECDDCHTTVTVASSGLIFDIR